MHIFQVVLFFAIAKAAKTESVPIATSSEATSVYGESVRVKRELPPEYNMTLHRENDGQLYIRITTGTTRRFFGDGERVFKLLFDTGSMPTWINGMEAEGNFYPIPPWVPNVLRNSDDYAFRVQYADRSWAQGTYYSDYICLNELLCAPKQYFGLVNPRSMAKLRGLDGVFGMANFKDKTPVQQDGRENRYFPNYSILQKIFEANNMDKTIQMMGLSLQRNGGLLTVGNNFMNYFDKEYEVYWIKVQKNAMRYWQLEGTSFGIKFKGFAFHTAILNSGVHEILAPNDVVDQVYDLFFTNSEGYFPCFEMQNFTNFNFEFGEYTVALEPVDYVIREQRAGHPDCCRIGMKYSNSNAWHLGFIFLRKRYIIFSYDNSNSAMIGFAMPLINYDELSDDYDLIF